VSPHPQLEQKAQVTSVPTVVPLRVLSVTLRETVHKATGTSFLREVSRFFFAEWTVSHFKNTSS
jgi:hypothetical protein